MINDNYSTMPMYKQSKSQNSQFDLNYVIVQRKNNAHCVSLFTQNLSQRAPKSVYFGIIAFFGGGMVEFIGQQCKEEKDEV